MNQHGRPLRHSFVVRLTHWLTVLWFLALLVSGTQLVISHPRFYWGETGNVMTPALFQIPIPSSRASVPTGYGYVLPDQNRWSRALHFQAAWMAVFTGLLYVAAGLWSRHFRKDLLPRRADLNWAAFRSSVAGHMRFAMPAEGADGSYNLLQRMAYLVVVFGLFPLMIWTGLAMSPAFVSAVPLAVEVLGGHQSARTIHFFATVALVAFVLIHLMMVILAGFVPRVRAMVTGTAMHTEGEP
ncbi:MAG: cytochrome b/b6 domain-containing protein [Bryobacterales bacterium]|nr:cytochrome b/b6 domain-containing protein [Bryobacterales bacterium]